MNTEYLCNTRNCPCNQKGLDKREMGHICSAGIEIWSRCLRHTYWEISTLENNPKEKEERQK
jgi:hypothetical protein